MVSFRSAWFPRDTLAFDQSLSAERLKAGAEADAADALDDCFGAGDCSCMTTINATLSNTESPKNHFRFIKRIVVIRQAPRNARSKSGENRECLCVSLTALRRRRLRVAGSCSPGGEERHRGSVTMRPSKPSCSVFRLASRTRSRKADVLVPVTNPAQS